MLLEALSAGTATNLSWREDKHLFSFLKTFYLQKLKQWNICTLEWPGFTVFCTLGNSDSWLNQSNIQSNPFNNIAYCYYLKLEYCSIIVLWNDEVLLYSNYLSSNKEILLS
jgi:hypothetical protein